jgi:hypothetical protein
MSWFHVSTVVMFVCVLSFPSVMTIAAASPAQQGAPPQPPPNIHIAEVLADVFDDLLSASPTFAAQCDRIAHARYVHVTVNPVMSMSTTSRGSARTTMRRFSSGALLASVDMPVPLTTIEYAELFGHEFEHIIEQVDRVNLEALTLLRDGASRLSDGAYETTRARRVGQAIADEAEHFRPVAIDPSIQPPPHPPHVAPQVSLRAPAVPAAVRQR